MDLNQYVTLIKAIIKLEVTRNDDKNITGLVAEMIVAANNVILNVEMLNPLKNFVTFPKVSLQQHIIKMNVKKTLNTSPRRRLIIPLGNGFSISGSGSGSCLLVWRKCRMYHK